MLIREQPYGVLPDGRKVRKFTLSNNQGMEIHLINYGAIITSVVVPDREGEPGDVVLGFDNLEGYLGEHPYIGAMVGRFCNRIGNARFELDGTTYSLTANEGSNHLHGGAEGFDRKLWSASPHQGDDSVHVKLSYVSQDGEEGYPGTLRADVQYSLNNRNELGISCRAVTDRKTHVNLTNHSYFNLNNCRGTIHDHELRILADRITELDDRSIPTGRILSVEGTPYDFRRPHAIGDWISRVEPGYDINYVLDAEAHSLKLVASVHDPVSGRSMEVLTTLPGLQLYTSNHIEGLHGRGGAVYGKHCAVCLETQFFPDSPNQQSFPSTVLVPGDVYKADTVYRFVS